MTARRPHPPTPTLGQQIECLFRHFPILCRECGWRIEWDEDRDWDHLVEHADGGEHHPKNWRPIHARSIGCHRKKTKRSAGQRAEAKRQDKAREQAEARERGELTYTRNVVAVRPKQKIPSRPFLSQKAYRARQEAQKS
jgi:hypothetical protein